MQMSRFSLRALLAAGVLVTACGQTSPATFDAAHQEFALPGSDGDLTLTDGITVVNQYAVLAADASAGATRVQVTDISQLTSPTSGPLDSGDLVFIMQMQGASIDTSEGPAYGAIAHLNGAGLHEFAVVQRVEGNTIHLGCAGLRHGYTPSGRTQVVRVPQYNNVTIENGAFLVARPWDGQSGGVVVVDVSGTTTLNGSINVSGQGFRGGAVENFSRTIPAQVTLYRSGDAQDGAEKGESIAGDTSVYDALGGRYGRGAPANGGGGGNSHNAAGGGGANGNNGRPWSGQGVMSASVVGDSAWRLDPGYIANGNALTDSSGGGRGGYSAASLNQDALKVGPTNASWGGDLRAEVGGLGGRPLDNDVSSRLFLGGGGGAGDANDSAGSPGGNGGGLVYLISPTVAGSGEIQANGDSALNTLATHNDAPGGGGGGGTVVILSNSLSDITVQALGGQGGSQVITTAEAEGPGGGGGGGFIAVSGGTPLTFVNGGLSGTTSSLSLAEFPSNGATYGADGQLVTVPNLSQPWLACASLDLAIAITDGQTSTVPGATVTYTVTVTNMGLDTVTDALVSVQLPVNATGATWTCSGEAGATCQDASGTGGIATNVTVPVGGTVTFTFVVDVSPSATGTVDVTATVSESGPQQQNSNLANNTATDIDTIVTQEGPIGGTHRVVGNGCSSSGNSGLMGGAGMVLALVFLSCRSRPGRAVVRSRRLRSLVVLGAVGALTASGASWAQGTSAAIDVQQFRPAPGKADVLGLHSPGVQGDRNWRAGLYLNYAHEPLVVINPDNSALLQHLVRNQFGFDLMGAIGLGERFELGLVAPLKLQHGEFNELPTGNLAQSWKGGLGDLRLVPKVLLLERDTLRLGLAVPVVLPTGGASELQGQKGFGMQPRLAVDYAFKGGPRLLANVGLNVRSRQELANLSVGHELSYGVGAAIPFEVKEHPFTGLASLGGALGLGATGGANEEERPLELQAGLQTRVSKGIVATLGVGKGLTLGYGMPVFRVFSGFAYTVEQPPRLVAKDSDSDSLADGSDACPSEPEDKDGFQDEDGCPDPDNDSDGVADAGDLCPTEKETINGVEDTDGCPDEGESQVQVTPQKLVIKEKVYFATNKDVVLERSFPLLQQVALVLKANPQLKKVRIEGHTDDRADDAFNMDLSRRRAGNVLKYLVKEAGIDTNRLISEGFGETRPVDTTLTDAGRENNRRVEFVILDAGDTSTPK
ncbi:OmpA family protein [Hyalangium minutum]|uniref:Calcium-binding acidic-repeat protein (ARP) n=1 Tax=Hyalangium minutum TaxID=394096 RepID=A0A085W973_9BACT|nr:OmpA family protein [Hyalangium minutum]KFE64236.1 Calcium-binding acidic-repeat protein precursor (ARP) [Hyalangium minutum]